MAVNHKYPNKTKNKELIDKINRKIYFFIEKIIDGGISLDQEFAAEESITKLENLKTELDKAVNEIELSSNNDVKQLKIEVRSIKKDIDELKRKLIYEQKGKPKRLFIFIVYPIVFLMSCFLLIKSCFNRIEINIIITQSGEIQHNFSDDTDDETLLKILSIAEDIKELIESKNKVLELLGRKIESKNYNVKSDNKFKTLDELIDIKSELIKELKILEEELKKDVENEELSLISSNGNLVQSLDKIANYLKYKSSYVIKFAVHPNYEILKSNSVELVIYDLVLKERLEEVKYYLILKGIESERIQIGYEGENEPKYPNRLVINFYGIEY